MSIKENKYVSIFSGVGGQAAVSERELIARIFTANLFLPTNSFAEFTSAKEIGDYFGTNSQEYGRGVQYFSFISKSLSSPRKISFARWTYTDQPPRIFGKKLPSDALANLQAVGSGSLTLNIAGDVQTVTGLNFTTATSLNNVASILQAAINALVGTMWTGATVSYSPAFGRFEFAGGDAIEATIFVLNSVGIDIKDLIGWGVGATLSDGDLEQTITETLQASSDASNNFGSFTFIPALTIDEVVDAATWNNLQNFMYRFSIRSLKADAQDYYDALSEIGGSHATISQTVGSYPEILPMAILASTRYDKEKSVQSYMYQQNSGLASEVTTDAEFEQFKAIRTNFYGQTQQAGQRLSFYQLGTMYGGLTDAIDMNIYDNEVWLKDAVTVAILNAFLGLPEIPSNDQGIAQVTSVIQQVINRALSNGVISIGKPLTPIQKTYIDSRTNDELAWVQVQSIGFWLKVSISTIDIHTMEYLLIYSKDDTIRKVEGVHTLI